MRIAVFTGASRGTSPQHAQDAEAVGRALAEADVGVVYGGGRVGLMGAVADGALGAGGEVIGVIPRSLVDRELAHQGLTRLDVVDTLHERKARMAELADAFVALPGGSGTLDEWFEAWTWGQLGLHDKPVTLLSRDGFWDPLLGLLDHLAGAGFLSEAHRDRVPVVRDADELLAAIAQWTPAPARWSRGTVLGSVAWVHVRDRQVLVVRPTGSDAFHLPGGKPEPGEREEEALVREVDEELGIVLDGTALRRRFTIEDVAHGDGRRLRMACFSGMGRGEPQPGREIAEVAWVDDPADPRLAPAVRQVVERLAAEGDLPTAPS